MSRKRLSQVSIGTALVIIIALTVRRAAATTSIIPDADVLKNTRSLECDSLPSRYSIHTEYVNELGRSMIYTEDGPTGVDGGLIYLLSNYRSCSP